MNKRRTSIVAALVAIAAMALGGVALANNATVHANRHLSAAHKAALSHRAPAVTSSGVDPDNIQSGDQSTPDRQSSAAQGASGAEKSAGEQSSDGPGGHEDATGSESAGHQFEGEE